MAFKRVVRKKPEETKAEAKKQPVRKVTINILAQKKSPKATPLSASGTAKRKKKSDIDLVIESSNVTIIPHKTCA